MDISGYKINWDKGAAAIPQGAADSAMLADINALRFMLLSVNLRRFPTAAELNVSEDVYEDSVNFWVNTGVVVLPEKKTEIPAQKSKVSKAAVPQFRNKTPGEIADAVSNDPSIAMLFREAAVIKGKPLNHTEQQCFCWISEYLCLPPEITIMLYSFAYANGKRSCAYLQAAAQDWAERGITDTKQAESEILLMQKTAEETEQIKAYMEQSDIPGNHSDKAVKWQRRGIGLDLIRYAFDYAKRKNKLSIEYIDRILCSFADEGIVGAQDAIEKEKRNSKKNKSTKNELQVQFSYYSPDDVSGTKEDDKEEIFPEKRDEVIF